MITIQHVQKQDKIFWFKLDKHLSEEEFEKKVRDKMGYILSENNISIALLRYNLFWDNTPFCTMLYVDKNFRNKGYGKILMEHWEKEMMALGYGMLMVSTQVDESAQHFYRKLGYADAGSLVINVPDYEQPMEMFMIKGLNRATMQEM